MPVDYRIIVARRDFRKMIGQGLPAADLANTLNKPLDASGSAKASFTDGVCSCFGISTFLLYFLFSNLFDFFQGYFLGKNNVR